MLCSTKSSHKASQTVKDGTNFLSKASLEHGRACEVVTALFMFYSCLKLSVAKSVSHTEEQPHKYLEKERQH